MIHPNYFKDLLDCLAGQFFTVNVAECVGDDFGINISKNAKDYFTVAIIPERLENDLVVLGVLLDDSYHLSPRNGFTFAIYIDVEKITERTNPDAVELIGTIIIAHEACHFVSYYEHFIQLGDSTGIAAHSNFKHAVSTTLMGAITEEQDSTSQNIFDEHNIEDLIRNMRRFPKKHFSKRKESKIDYMKFFNKFLEHLNFDEKLEEHRNRLII